MGMHVEVSISETKRQNAKTNNTEQTYKPKFVTLLPKYEHNHIPIIFPRLNS